MEAWCLLLLLALPGGGAQDEALQHLLRGNELAGKGRHLEAIAAWRVAAEMRPDSNVPLNNMANSYLGLEQLDDALREAREAFRRKADYMTAVTLSNVHKKKKQYREAESVLLEGIAATIKGKEAHEEPFWSLASLYWDQGDYIEFLKYAHLGLKHKAPESCQPQEQGPCSIPPFEIDIVDKMWNASADVAKFLESRGKPARAREVVGQAAELGSLYSRPWAEHQDQRVQGCGRCDEVAEGSGRFARMAAVRLMNCDWRHRRLDESWVTDKLSKSVEVLLREAQAPDSEWLFECEGGLVCGAGGQPPLHLWALDTPDHTVKTMGQVQHGLLRVKMLEHGAAQMRELQAPAMSQPRAGSLSPSLCVGLGGRLQQGARRRLHLGLLSSDLLRDHPVGNMMRHALPLFDLSRTELTVFLVHEHQRHAAEQLENKFILGDVRLVMLGRGPPVSQLWDLVEAERGAHLINDLGVCILVDLIGYTSDHRQDVLALRPAPLQISYHGYMGTTGASHIDLYMADRVIAPPEHARGFTERLVLLAESFLGPSHRIAHQMWGSSGGSRNDFDYRGEDDEATRRVANGLPPFGPVLCNFNQHFKMDPATFATWRAAVAELNATLWLLRGSSVSERNLAREFEAAGGAGRLIWAERMPIKDHLRRGALCDIGLDTLHYNMGATGADTLFSSVPVVHVASNKMVGRMMSSMLRALRTEELILRHSEDMKTLVVKLGSPSKPGREKLRRLRAKLVRRILWSPLFDVGAWVNDMELALRLVWEAHVARRTTTDSGTNHNDMGRHFDADVDNVVAVRPRAIF